MSEVPLWFERKFRFDFPTEHWPNICIRLRGTPARLEELTRGLSVGVLTRCRAAGKWSIQENAGHLLDLEPLWLTRLDDFLGGAATLTAADLTNRRTHEARHNSRPLEEILSAFRTARGTLLRRLESLLAADYGRLSRHPRLNLPMSLVDHLFFVAEHDDHHLARIWELRED